MVDKIKVDEPPEVNCEVVVDPNVFLWEPRFYREDTGYVYAYHKSYLWPQRKSEEYYKFRMLRVIGTAKEDVAEFAWQTFMDYNVFNKGETKDD